MFVLEGKKFIVLPEAEKGVFYSESCYAFVCRYFFAPELPEGEGTGLCNWLYKAVGPLFFRRYKVFAFFIWNRLSETDFITGFIVGQILKKIKKRIF